MPAQTYKDFIPPWQDLPTLCKHLCISPNTVESWADLGILPRGRLCRGKLMWKWAEVDAYLTNGGDRSPDAIADKVRDGSRQQAEARRAGR